MKNYIKIAALLTLCIISCTKIEDLSSDNTLKSFEILSHTPESIVIGDIEISADTVYVAIEYGKYEFPLSIRAKATASSGAYIYGVDSNEEIVFDQIDSDAHRFVVSAENGTSKNYYVALVEEPLGDSAELLENVSFLEAADSELLLSELLLDGELDSERLILAIDTQYPLMVTPTLSVEATTIIESYRVEGSAEWLPFDNGATQLTFDDAECRYELSILSESGNRATWLLGSLLIDFSLIDSTTQINYKELEATLSQAELTIMGYEIDFETGEITILIEEPEQASIEFPLEISVDIPVSEWLTLIGLPDSMSYRFNSWDDTFTFALLYLERLKSTGWSLAIKMYEPTVDSAITIDSATVSDFSCGSTTVAYIFKYDHLTLSTSKPDPKIYESSREIHLYYDSYYKPTLSSTSISSWWAEVEFNLALSNSESVSQSVRWEAVANSSGKITQTEIDAAVTTTQYIEVEQADGSVELWSVTLVNDDTEDSSACELLSFEVISTTPNYIDFKDPAYTIDAGEGIVYINVGERYNFPMSIDLSYEVSPYASATPTTLYFEDESSQQSITITAQDGTSVNDYSVEIIIPQATEAPAISSISFGELPSGVSMVGTPTIDAENYTVTIGIEATNADFPLSIPVASVEIEDEGSIDLPSSGALTFNSASSNATAWVNSADDTSRQIWQFKIFYYEQISGGDMNSWEMDASPVTSSLPWSTPNMSGIAAVTNTTPGTGYSGESDDYAAEMQTGTSWGTLAAGSIFTGWFDKDNSTSYGLSDPVRLTYFGTPFAPDATIKGISAVVSYVQASDAVDWGSLTVILIAEDPTKTFVFHGDKPNDYDDPTQGSAPHPDNTATEVAIAKMIFGNGSATQTSYGDTIDMNLTAGEWSEIFIPISSDQPFSHISIAAASSAYGDYFIGETGSVMRLDNVKIIYE